MTSAPPCALGRQWASRVTLPLALALVAALLSACASFSPDGGVDLAADVARRELGQDAVAIRTPEDAAAAKERVGRLLKRPLNANGAVEVALRSNRGLQAAYNRLGIAEAIMVRESLPPNPNISLGGVAGPLSSEIEGTIAADILALATLPARADIAAAVRAQTEVATLIATSDPEEALEVADRIFFLDDRGLRPLAAPAADAGLAATGASP